MQSIEKFIIKMQVIDKSTIKNAKHREIYYKQCKSSMCLIYKIKVIDKITKKKGEGSVNLLQKMQVIEKFTIKNTSH